MCYSLCNGQNVEDCPMTYPTRFPRPFVLFALLFLIGGGSMAASVTEELAVGAVMVANAKLFANPDDQAGLDLLRFALALDPENHDALLIQAKLDRKQKLDDVQLADGGKQYVDYLLNVAKQTRSKKRRLLLYKVVELVAPRNEQALLELTKAKNKGVDTSFGALLQIILPDAPKGEDEGDDDDTPAPASRTATTGKPTAPEDILAALEDAGRRTGYSYYGDPTYSLNNVNRTLSAQGLIIRYESKKSPLRESTGMAPLYYLPSSGVWPAATVPDLSTNYSTDVRTGDQTLGDWLRIVCGWHGLGWCLRSDGIAIVDPDNKDLAKGSGLPVLADALVAASKEGRLEFRDKYYEKRLFVYGYVSGVSKEYVHMVHDQVRITFGSGVDATRIQALSGDYGEAKRDDSGNRVVFFVGTGMCDGIRTGRITVTDCTSFSWYLGRRQN